MRTPDNNNHEQTVATQPIAPQSAIVQGGGEPVDIQAVAGLFRGLIEPFAKSQEFAESEKTKRVQIEAATLTSFLRYSFGLAAMILAIAVVALFLGKDQFAEKVVFAVIGFVGGFAFGKGSQTHKG